jgi:hypothetical protein
MARWALLMLVISGVGVTVTAGGVYYVARTLDATRDAVKAANKTADEAKRIGEAQVRAYLSCQGAKYEISSDWVTCEVTIHNHGQSPAIWSQISGQIVTRTKAAIRSGGGFTRSELSSGRGPTIPAGGDGTMFMAWSHGQIGEEAQTDLFRRGRHFDIRCRIEWLDVFDQKLALDFVLDPAGEGVMVGTSMRRGSMKSTNLSVEDYAHNPRVK